MLHCAPIMHCTLLVPDLLPPGLRDALHPQPRAPRLAALLARGTSIVLPAGGSEAWLCDAFGVARQHDWPVAALTLIADGGEPADGYWLRCDPVHLYFRQNSMHVSSACGIPPDADSRALVDALNTHFHADGMLFRAGHDGRWYVRDDMHTGLTTQPLPEALDRAIDAFTPSGADSGYWRRVLNEIQMLLHAHPLNAEREARGLPAFNSVWLWGGGRASDIGIPPCTQLWTDDALARALAARSATPNAPLPPTADAVFAAGGDALVILPAARDAGRKPEIWRQSIEQMEHNWFAPCYSALQMHRLEKLSIVVTGTPHGRRCEITARNLWRWWRCPQALNAYA
jgi:hypothetical protein